MVADYVSTHEPVGSKSLVDRHNLGVSSATVRNDMAVLDDVMRRSVRLLAQLTQQVAVVQYPTLTRSTVRHVEVVTITPARLMLVLITDTGRVDQRMVDLGDVITEEDAGRMRTVLNSAMAEK